MAKKIPPHVKVVLESKVEEVENAKRISFSQLLDYLTCHHRWDLLHRQKVMKSIPNINLIFGTAMHEVIQEWLQVIYTVSAAAAEEMPLSNMLSEKLYNLYKEEKVKYGEHFSTPEELSEYYEDGVRILEYLVKKRSMYFSTKQVYLAGIETLLYQELKPGFYFKGFVDLILYDEKEDKWIIIDIKTSKSGWNSYTKSDENKISQVLLYKEFFSRQFNIPVEKIEVKYFIIKRKVMEEAEYEVMKRRVQEFEPPAGTAKRKKALSNIEEFVQNVLSEDGEYIDKPYLPASNAKSCKFCIFKDSEYCSHGV